MSSKEQSQFSFQKITFHLIGVLNTPHSPGGDTRETERSLFQAVWRRLLSSRNQTLLDRTSDSKVMPQPGESPLVPTPPTEHRAHRSPRCSCVGGRGWVPSGPLQAPRKGLYTSHGRGYSSEVGGVFCGAELGGGREGISAPGTGHRVRQAAGTWIFRPVKRPGPCPPKAITLWARPLIGRRELW